MLFPPRDRAWRTLAPGFADLVRLASVGLPFQIASHRRYDRSGRLRRLRPALRAGKTVFFPGIHQVLPRVMRLMVALRVAFMGPGREEASFLFLVDGAGREGLGLHHDDDVHAFWLQLEGRRTVTLGPPVQRGRPQDLPDHVAHEPGFTTRALAPGSLLYLPPRTPHRVLCFERSVALSLTWSVARPAGRTRSSLATWDVVSGRVADRPPTSRTRLWTQVPAIANGETVVLPDGERARVRGLSSSIARDLALMSSFSRAALPRSFGDLEAHGIVAPQDLPRVVIPQDPGGLDGWRFA